LKIAEQVQQQQIDQEAREAASRMQCTNHLKQIGIGVHNFHDTRTGLPSLGLGSRNRNGAQRITIWGLILPFVEQQPLYDFICTSNSAIGSTSTMAAGAVNAAGTETVTSGHGGIYANFGNKWFNEIGETQQNAFGSIAFYKCPTRRNGISIYTRGTTADDVGNNADRNGPLGDYAAVLCRNTTGSSWYGDTHDPVTHAPNINGPFRIANLTMSFDIKSWEPRDSMAWWQDGTSNVTVYFPILFFFWRFRYSRLFFSSKVLFSALCFGVTLYFFQLFFVFEYFFNWNFCFRVLLSEPGVRHLIGMTPQHILRSTPVKIPSIAVSRFPILK
jgi:hypothetical protein